MKTMTTINKNAKEVVKSLAPHAVDDKMHYIPHRVKLQSSFRITFNKLVKPGSYLRQIM